MKGRGTAALALSATLLLLVAVTGVEAVDFWIQEVEVEPEPVVSGDPAEVNLTVYNGAGERLDFTEESSLSIYLDGELVRESGLLVKPNYTDPPEYFSVPSGGTSSWTVTLNERETGVRDLRLVLSGPYEVGESTRDGESVVEREVEVANPPVEGFDLWVSKYGWGLEPTVSVVGGNAYTGNLSIEIRHNGSTTFSEEYPLAGETTVTDGVETEEYFEGNGSYVVEVSLFGSNVSREIEVGGNSSGSTGLARISEGVSTSAPAPEGSSGPKGSPGPGAPLAALAVVLAVRLMG